ACGGFSPWRCRGHPTACPGGEKPRTTQVSPAEERARGRGGALLGEKHCTTHVSRRGAPPSPEKSPPAAVSLPGARLGPHQPEEPPHAAVSRRGAPPGASPNRRTAACGGFSPRRPPGASPTRETAACDSFA